jgi:single-stranded-DNA-specific exonuclease
MLVAEWKVEAADPQRASALAREAGLDQITAQLLLNRGVQSRAETVRFFDPGLDGLEDPMVFPDMAKALARIRRAIAAGEPILIFGDSDVDGLTASVILYEVLRELGAHVRARPANRIADGYGLPASLVRQLCRSATKLVVLVDCGTNQSEAIRTLAAHGIDTIVIDHHVPLDGWAEPLALVNPQRGEGPGRELCSAGLAFSVARALLPADRVAAYLDLAALGTLADCSPLRAQNRILVSSGLERLVQSPRQGLKRLCEATGTVSPDPEQVVRRLVPRLNASGRLGDPQAVWHLLCRDGQDTAEAWLAAAESAHTETKQLHRQTLGEAQEQINRLHFRDQYVLVVSREGWPQGLMGPLASMLAERYGRPAIAIAMKQRRGVGSGRSVPVYDLLSALKRCQRLLMEFGGHAQACGLTLNARDLEPFRALVNNDAREQLGREGLLRTRRVDLELPLAALEPAWVKRLEQFAPFGHGNPRPTVVIRHLAIETTSPRTGWVTDGKRRVRAKGSLPTVLGTRYDVAATPAVVGGEMVLMVSDVRVSSGLSAPDRTSGTSYRRGPA